MAVSPTGVSKSMISYRVLLFSLARQELSSTRSGTTLLKINFRNIIVELHSNGVVVRCFNYVLFLFEDFDLVTKRSLAIDVCIESSGTSIVACLSFSRLEEMKL